MSRAMELLTPGLRVTNLSRSVRFYTKVLGLREIRRGDTRSWGGGLWVQLEDPKSRQRLELNWYPRGSIFHGAFRAGDALDHIDFDLGPVPVAELERTYRRLVRGGARPTRYHARTTAGWMAGAIDPNGIWIVLSRQPTPAERRTMERVDGDAPGTSAPPAASKPRRRRGSPKS
jgi:catechol 2,3-dioxygenase-like lactoylglutathione lyase family enzyme